MKLLLSPGNLVCDIAELEENSDHRIIFRMFCNTLIYGVLGTAVVVAITV